MQRNHVTIRPLNREDSVLYFPPEAFGPFRVLHQIGAGTLGPVFRAYEAERDRLVAIKVFRVDLTPEQSAELVKHLDALIARDIRHPNIAAPLAAGIDVGAAYLAQEYVVGESLDVVLRSRGPMPVGEAVAMVESLASAIDHAALRGVHHGALHLRDVIVSADTARITGLGFGEALKRVSARLPTRPQYAPADGPSDIYALGAIAFEMITGKRVSTDHLNDFEESHGPGLRAAFECALASDAANRVTHAGDFARALREATGETGATGGKSPQPVRGAEPPSTRERGWGPATADESAPSPQPVRTEEAATTIEIDAFEDLDLRIDRPVDLMDPEDDPVDRVIERTPVPVSGPWSATPEPPRVFEAVDGPAEPPGRRWPIVAAFLGFALLAAWSVGFFLESSSPVAMREPAAGVDETTVDLPAPAPVPQREPARESASKLPAPTPSRPAAGVVAREQRPLSGSLLIRSSPADADVMVNGRARGKTPLTVRDLTPGSYTIRVARDGYATEERELHLTARRPVASTTFTLRPTAGIGGLNVQSRPAGARVFVNDQPVGSTPLAMPGVQAGPATVRIELDGYRAWTTTVEVGVGAPTRVAASLERK